MKYVVSISLGSSKRDKSVEIELLGEKVKMERIGTDGDMESAAQLYRELDGKADAFGVGGADMGFRVGKRWYPVYSIKPEFRFVKKTPIVDGAGLKITLEGRIVPFMEENIGGYIQEKKALITSALDRWGMAKSFLDAKYRCVFGDFMFGLGLPLPIHEERSIKILAAILMPIIGHFPFRWLYPTGEKQEARHPKWKKYFLWASVIAGDCMFIKCYMPESLEKKVIVTNTTTSQDIELFKKAGVKYLITTTPLFEGRSFGTNMIEAALIAVSGKKRVLTDEELNQLLIQAKIMPQLQKLN